jgi:hypothetical protein
MTLLFDTILNSVLGILIPLLLQFILGLFTGSSA